MKPAILAGACRWRSGRSLCRRAYWVVGNRATSKCDIETSNPVIIRRYLVRVHGPYKSLADAKLARSTIGACPEKDPSK